MTNDQPAFMQFLSGWHNELHGILATDPEGFLGRQYPSLACNILDSFPCYDILQKYVNPLTMFSPNEDTDYCRIESSQPCLKKLASICERQFQWTSEVVTAKLHALVWEGSTLQWLCRVNVPSTILVTITYVMHTHLNSIAPHPRPQGWDKLCSCSLPHSSSHHLHHRFTSCGIQGSLPQQELWANTDQTVIFS